jgi:hypothetical protein
MPGLKARHTLFNLRRKTDLDRSGIGGAPEQTTARPYGADASDRAFSERPANLGLIVEWRQRQRSWSRDDAPVPVLISATRGVGDRRRQN